jgi:hypothetical protein
VLITRAVNGLKVYEVLPFDVFPPQNSQEGASSALSCVWYAASYKPCVSAYCLGLHVIRDF